MSASLVVQDLVKSFGRRKALDGLSLEVPSGSTFGIVGSNGAGKTTFMAVVAGLLQSHAGWIDLLGAGPFDPARHAGRITLLPQDSRFPPHALVEELLAYYGCLQGIPKRRLPGEIQRVLEWTHLSDRRRSAIRTLSHGMNRRLAIAQAFLGAPELVMLDEPLSGLDPREAARIRDLLNGQRGQRTVLISSHDLHDLEVLCDHVAFIEQGRLVRQDTLERVVHRGTSLSYVLALGTAPLDDLSACLPDVQWCASADGSQITATFGEPLTPGSVNALALPVLLRAGVQLLEIRRGSSLEQEYLSLSQPPPLPPSHG